jgi:hypothetical protein
MNIEIGELGKEEITYYNLYCPKNYDSVIQCTLRCHANTIPPLVHLCTRGYLIAVDLKHKEMFIFILVCKLQ